MAIDSKRDSILDGLSDPIAAQLENPFTGSDPELGKQALLSLSRRRAARAARWAAGSLVVAAAAAALLFVRIQAPPPREPTNIRHRDDGR
jgi:hypothetical protein